MGHPPTDDDMYAIIIGSLPPSYDPYISAVSATSSVLGTSLSADELMSTITNEYERRLLTGKESRKDENIAFHSNAGPLKGRKGGPKKDVECFNCHKKGHYKADCWAEGGGKKGEGPRMKEKLKGKGKDAAAAATATVVANTKAAEEKVEAWMVSIMDDSEGSSGDRNSPCSFDFIDDLFEDGDTMPDLQSISDTDSEIYVSSPYHSSNDDNTLEIQAFNSKDEPTTPSNSLTPPNDSDSCSELPNNLDTSLGEFEFTPIDEEAYVTTYKTSVLQGGPGVLPTNVDLYDSGASRHMSGFRHRFINLVKINPKPITAADRWSFNAMGKGDMWILLPNGDQEKSHVLLKEVLYTPTMGVTLVSIS